MKTVLLVSEAKALGGAEAYLERLALNLPGWEARLALPAAAVMDGWERALKRRDLPVLRYPGGPRGLLALCRNLGDRHLVHLNLPSTYDGGAGLLPAGLSLLGRRPVVVTEHLTRVPRSRRRLLLKRFCRGAAAATVVVSRASKEALVEEGFTAERITVIPNGVPDPGEVVAVAAEEGPLRIGVLATLEERKQVHVLIEAVSRVPEVVLEIAGDGPLRPRLEDLARCLGVQDRVRFAGQIEDPYAFLAGQHLLALSSRLEGMPLVVLEAFACGRGVLVSDLPGLDEVVQADRTGRLLPCAEPAAWTEALAWAAGHREAVNAWGQAARERYRERFTMERCAEATAALYDRVLAGKKG